MTREIRDMLLNEYFGVNIHRAWKVAKQDIFVLSDELKKVKKDLETQK
jgi:uncharacterized protein with HEPN domain